MLTNFFKYINSTNETIKGSIQLEGDDWVGNTIHITKIKLSNISLINVEVLMWIEYDELRVRGLEDRSYLGSTKSEYPNLQTLLTCLGGPRTTAEMEHID